MPLLRLIRRAHASSFIRSVAVLTSGSVIAQIIPVLMLPIFTRMFDASVFGMQALLLVGISFFLPLVTGFYEFALPSPRSNRHARGIVTIALSLSATFNLLMLALIACFREPLAHLLGLEVMGNWIYAYPVVIFSFSLLNISNYWLLRQGKFRLQSLNKIFQASLGAAMVLMFGLAHMAQGLLAGFVLGIATTGLFALMQARRHHLRLDYHSTRLYYWRLMRKYAEFPIFGGLPSAINNLAAQVPVIIITAHYSLATTGHYSVVRNLLLAASFMIASGVGLVIHKKFADMIIARQPLWRANLQVTGLLVATGIAASAALFFLGPWFFGLYLGRGWEDSAEIVRTLAPLFVFWLVGPALANAVMAIKKLRMIALWQVMHGVMAFVLIGFSHLPFDEFLRCVVMYEAFSYTLYFILMTLAVYRYDRAQKSIQTL